MQKENHFFEDLSRLASSATGMAMDMRREVEQLIQQQTDQFLANSKLVTREEFEVVKAMAEQARLENEALRARLDALENNDISDNNS